MPRDDRHALEPNVWFLTWRPLLLLARSGRGTDRFYPLRNCRDQIKLPDLLLTNAVRFVVRDHKRPSRRLLVQSGGALFTTTMLAKKEAVGEESSSAVQADSDKSRRQNSLDTDYFKGMYANDPDPWRFATSAYEQDKYAATLAALPRSHYLSALDVGCSIGVFTRQLCPRCDELIGLDVVPSVLDAARARCADCPNANFKLAAVPGAWPDGQFDLIVISEVAYYLDRADLVRLVARVESSLLPEADIVLVHWLGITHYSLSGDEAAEGFIVGADSFTRVLKQSRTAEYRLDVLRATKSDARSGQ